MSDPKSIIVALTGYAIVPVLLTIMSTYMMKKYNVGRGPMLGIAILIAIGIPSFLTLWWPDLANSLKKNGNTNIDSSLAGAWIATSLIVSFLAWLAVPMFMK